MIEDKNERIGLDLFKHISPNGEDSVDASLALYEKCVALVKKAAITPAQK